MEKIVAEAAISQKTDGAPKIYLGLPGEKISVMFDLYGVTPDQVLSLVTRLLRITIEPQGARIGVPYTEDDD